MGGAVLDNQYGLIFFGVGFHRGSCLGVGRCGVAVKMNSMETQCASRNYSEPSGGFGVLFVRSVGLTGFGAVFFDGFGDSLGGVEGRVRNLPDPFPELGFYRIFGVFDVIFGPCEPGSFFVSTGDFIQCFDNLALHRSQSFKGFGKCFGSETFPFFVRRKRVPSQGEVFFFGASGDEGGGLIFVFDEVEFSVQKADRLFPINDIEDEFHSPAGDFGGGDVGLFANTVQPGLVVFVEPVADRIPFGGFCHYAASPLWVDCSTANRNAIDPSFSMRSSVFAQARRAMREADTGLLATSLSNLSSSVFSGLNEMGLPFLLMLIGIVYTTNKKNAKRFLI